MIRGAPFWNDRARFYVQTNNPTEEFGRKIREEIAQALLKLGVSEDIVTAAHVRAALQSCGSDALTNCAAALGRDFLVSCPGGFQPQIDELVTGFLNDPRNYLELRAARPGLDPAGIPGNRVPQWLPLAARDVFGIHGQYREGVGWGKLIAELAAGRPVQICLKIPGHYLACVAYDEATDTVIYNDSWPGRSPDGNGWNRRMQQAELANVQDFIIVYSI